MQVTDVLPVSELDLYKDSFLTPFSYPLLLRFSKKAKELLKTYDLSPRPKVVEVDLRSTYLRAFQTKTGAITYYYFSYTADADQIKALLTRLTSHSTFPNVFIDGKSIGGSDNLAKLHSGGELVSLLTDAGVSTNLNGEADDAAQVKA